MQNQVRTDDAGVARPEIGVDQMPNANPESHANLGRFWLVNAMAGVFAGWASWLGQEGGFPVPWTRPAYWRWESWGNRTRIQRPLPRTNAPHLLPCQKRPIQPALLILKKLF